MCDDDAMIANKTEDNGRLYGKDTSGTFSCSQAVTFIVVRSDSVEGGWKSL